MCNKKYACGCLIAVIISIIVAVIVANLITGVATLGIIAAVIVAVVFALVSLGYLAILSLDRDDKCVCENGKCLIIGALGTIVTGLVALALLLTIELTTLVIFVLALVTFFFVLNIIGTAILFFCLTNCKKMCEY